MAAPVCFSQAGKCSLQPVGTFSFQILRHLCRGEIRRLKSIIVWDPHLYFSLSRSSLPIVFFEKLSYIGRKNRLKTFPPKGEGLYPALWKLNVLEKDRLNPSTRLIFAGLLTIVIGLLISTEAVVFEVGSLSTKWFKTTKIQIPLLIGIFCGLSEQVLSTKVAQHTSDFIETK